MKDHKVQPYFDVFMIFMGAIASAREWATQAETKAQEAETRATEAEAKAQEAETRAQEAEAKAQEAETRAQEAETRPIEAEIWATSLKEQLVRSDKINDENIIILSEALAEMNQDKENIEKLQNELEEARYELAGLHYELEDTVLELKKTRYELFLKERHEQKQE